MSRMVEIQGLPLIKPKSDSVQMWQMHQNMNYVHATLLNYFLFLVSTSIKSILKYRLKIDFNRFSKLGGK